jgi:hypothetical protein
MKSRDKTKLRFTLPAVVVLGSVFVFIVAYRQAGVKITNTSADFQVVSVRVTRGTNHVCYFPSCPDWRRRAEDILRRFTPFIKAKPPEKIVLRGIKSANVSGESGEIFCCWIECTSRKRLFFTWLLKPESPVLPLSFLDADHKEVDFRLFVLPPYKKQGIFYRDMHFDLLSWLSRWDTKSGRGVLCWSFGSTFTNFAGGKLKFETALESSIIEFR